MLDFFQKLYSSPKRTLFYGILLLIILTGVFMRTYHFSDWLHFETDQVDDFFAVSPAIENGLGEMPLVGPKAAGTDLRLGPLFYLLESVSAIIFGNTPVGHASAVLFFSFLSIPLFFVTSRLFFKKTISLFLTAIFSTSIFLVLYSRFGWNPNILPFFTLLIIFTATKTVSERNPKKQIFWMAVFAVSLASIMQLHVAALITIPPCIAIFFLWKRPHLPKRAWVIALILFAIVFLPTILYEINSHGQTFHALISKTSGDSDNTKDGVKAELIQNIRYHSGEYLLILTGHDTINGSNRPKGSSFGLTCSSCGEIAPYRALGYAFLIVSLLLLIQAIRQETHTRKRDFLVLLLLLFIFSFFFFFSILISGKYLYPRFFLLVSPLPIFFFGLLLRAINPEKNVVRFYIVFILTAFIIFLNTTAVAETFEHNKRGATTKDIVVETEDIFPNTHRITLDQQERIVEFIAAKIKNDPMPLYLKSESEYEPSFWTLLQQNGVDFYGNIPTDSGLYEQGLYVFIFRSASPLTKDMSLYKEKLSIDEEVSFGSLTLQILKPKPEFIIGEKQAKGESYEPIESAIDIPRLKDITEK